MADNGLLRGLHVLHGAAAWHHAAERRVTFAGAAGEAMVKKYVLNGFKNAVCGQSSGSVGAAAPLRATAPGGCCAVHFVPSVGRSAAAAADPRLRSRPVPNQAHPNIDHSGQTHRTNRPAQPCSSFRGHSLQRPKWSPAVPSGVVGSVAPQSPPQLSLRPPPRSAPKQSRRRSGGGCCAGTNAAEVALRWACLLELGLHLLLHGAVGLEQRLQFRAQLHRSASDHSGTGGEAKARRPTVALASTRLAGVALPPASVGTAAAK
jgi:hypothetical protein